MVEAEVVQAEKDFGREEGSVLIMAAIESARGVMRALDICESSERLFGIAFPAEITPKTFRHTLPELESSSWEQDRTW